MVPTCTQGPWLAFRWIVAVKHEQILRNGVDLRETQPILSKLYVPRNVQEVALGRLDKNTSQWLICDGNAPREGSQMLTHRSSRTKAQAVSPSMELAREFRLPVDRCRGLGSKPAICTLPERSSGWGEGRDGLEYIMGVQ
jgi:hypothetical protein